MKNTIITAEDIRQVRPIANNVIDIKRIEPYINEAEILDVMPAIGIGLYERFTSDGFADEMENTGSVTVITDSGREILLTDEQWKQFLDGGYYVCDDGCCGPDKKRYSAGLRAAVSYLAYARMLPNQPIHVTAFGVVGKTAALSDPVDEKTLFRAANGAKQIGLEYVRQCVDHLHCKGFIDDCKKKGMGRMYKRFKAIG
jgi:hypothetical protein